MAAFEASMPTIAMVGQPFSLTICFSSSVSWASVTGSFCIISCLAAPKPAADAKPRAAWSVARIFISWSRSGASVP